LNNPHLIYYTLEGLPFIVRSITILFSNGRLGNQLIELLGVKSKFPDTVVVAINFDQARHYLNSNSPFIWLGSSRSYSLLARTFAKLFWLIRKVPLNILRIFASIFIESETNQLISAKAYIPFLKVHWIDGPFFQHSSSYSLPRIISFKPRGTWETGAQHLIFDSKYRDSGPNIPKNIFLHIRLGDYLSHRANNSIYSYIPSLSYYLDSINYLLNLHGEDSTIFVASDDINKARSYFLGIQQCVFVDESPEVTLSLMSLCDAGILSASSFSWWAAHYALIHNKKQGPFIAPKYWLGFSQKKWHPSGFHSAYLEYHDVNL